MRIQFAFDCMKVKNSMEQISMMSGHVAKSGLCSHNPSFCMEFLRQSPAKTVQGMVLTEGCVYRICNKGDWGYDGTVWQQTVPF